MIQLLGMPHPPSRWDDTTEDNVIYYCFEAANSIAGGGTQCCIVKVDNENKTIGLSNGSYEFNVAWDDRDTLDYYPPRETRY